MGKKGNLRGGAAALAVLGALGTLGGCAGFPWSGGEGQARMAADLPPLQGAWAAASVLAREVPSPDRTDLAPLVPLGPGRFLLEARARPGALYRFRRGARFRSPAGPPPLRPGKNPSLEEILREIPPQPLPVTELEERESRPFPTFYEAYLEVQVSPAGGEGCRIVLRWVDRPGEEVGPRVRAHLERALALLEPLAEGNGRLRRGDPVGALGAYDRALAAGRPPCCAFHARCLARIHFNRGLCLARMGDLEGALLALEKARSLAPRLPGAGLLAETLADLLDRNRREGPGSGGAEALLEKGRRLLERGMTREAARVFQVVRNRPGLSVAALQGLARADLEGGNPLWAKAHLLLALEESPGNPALLADLARLERREGDPVKALFRALPLGKDSPAFREVLAAFPPERTAPLLSLLGKTPPPLPPSPLGRVLAAARAGDPAHLTRIRWKTASLPALPPR